MSNRVKGLRLFHFVCLWFAVGPLMFWELGQASLFGDEAIYANVILDSLSTDQWLPPVYGDEPYLGKPPLGLWIQAQLVRLLGDGESSFRLFGATCGFLAVNVLALWLSRHIGPWTAVLGALLFGSGPQVLFRHGLRSGTFEGPMLLGFGLALLAATERSRFTRWALSAIAGLLGSLKGLGFGALAALSALPLLALAPPYARALLLAAAAAVALWIIQLGLLSVSVGGEELRRSLSEENLLRWTDSQLGGKGDLWSRFTTLNQEYGTWLLLGVIGLATAYGIRGKQTFKLKPLLPVAGSLAFLPLLILSPSSATKVWYFYPAFLGWVSLIAWGAHEMVGAISSKSGRVLLMGFLAVLVTQRIDSRWIRLNAYRPERVPERVLSDLLRLQTRCRLLLDVDFRPEAKQVREWSRFYLERRVPDTLKTSKDGKPVLIVTSEPGKWLASLKKDTLPVVKLTEPDGSQPLFLIDCCGGAYWRSIQTLRRTR